MNIDTKHSINPESNLVNWVIDGSDNLLRETMTWLSTSDNLLENPSLRAI